MPRPRISNLQVTGSNPVGRARNSNHRMVVLIFVERPWMRTCRFEPQAKGAHRATATMGIYNPVGRAINSNHRMVVLIFSVKTIKKRTDLVRISLVG